MAEAWTLVEHSMHLLAMAVIVGGSAVVALCGPIRQNATRFEWAFWLAAGFSVLTGVGNLGLRPTLAPAGSSWGVLLQLKMLAVALLFIVSFSRSVLVLAKADRSAIRLAAGMTVALAAAIAVAGVGLADV